VSSLPHVAILGAGPAALGAAWRLRTFGRARVTVLEQHQFVGGNAASFSLAGMAVDYGSHRLHPACSPEILADIRGFLGTDLLDRPRHGRIELRGRWVRFPLKPLDLLLRLDRTFAAGALLDVMAKPFRRAGDADSFAGVLLSGLGPTICREFYFPYARKIWGRDPEQLSAIQARRRVAADSTLRLVRKVLSSVPGLRPEGAGRFFYPRGGFGRISTAYAEAAVAAGAELRLGAKVVELVPRAGNPGWSIRVDRGPAVEAEYVWSTVPITGLARAVQGTPAGVLAAARDIRYRAMLLVYLVVDADRFTEYDAHYLPDSGIRITRLSEPKNYGCYDAPTGRTVLCAELPCDRDDATWQLDDASLGRLVEADLARAGLPLPRSPVEVAVRRLPFAYPVYLEGYERPFGVLDRWVESLPRLLSYGRQGLFAHDNTHHALAMAYAAVDCLEPGGWNAARWAKHRAVFATHVVED
jgi:protoporphyrinogen oxidase